MEPWRLGVLILLSVLVGALIPVLVQLFSTLRSARSWADRLGPKIDNTLTELQETTRRLNRAGAGLEESTKRASSLLDAAGDVGQTLAKLNRSLRTAATVGGAVAPAVAAMVKAFMENGPGRRAAKAEADPPSDPPESSSKRKHKGATA